MNAELEILGVKLKHYRVDAAMEIAEEYLSNDKLNTIGIVTMQMLMQASKEPTWKQYIEDLDLKTMSGEHHFGKSVHDNGWRMFTDFLQYKLEREGKKLVRIDRWYPSSRTCSCCGKIKHDLKLEERVYLCSCGNRMDRDENAAVNICREGLRMSGIILEKSEKAS
ncbi:MAG: transposase [Clostridiales bacterium]|nr:transposase [Clostridiales bacterium]